MFAYFRKILSKQFLITVDNRLSLFVYDVDMLISESMSEPIYKTNLIENARLFDYQQDYSRPAPEFFGLTKDEINRIRLNELKEKLLKNTD